MSRINLPRIGAILFCVAFWSLIGTALAHAQVGRTFFGQNAVCVAQNNLLCNSAGPTAWPVFAVGSQRSLPAGATWYLINTSSGVYNWTILDALVAAANAQGADVVMTLFGTPAWASSNPTDSTCQQGDGICDPPASNAYWTTFISAVIAHEGCLPYWEVWNEPNQMSHWTGTVAQMVTLQQLAYTTIKTACPNAKVLGPSTYPSQTASLDGVAWTNAFLAAGGGAYMDIANLHAYPEWYVSNPTPTEQDVLTVQRYSNVFALNGWIGPIWATEGGWEFVQNLTSSTLQAAYIVKHQALLQAAGYARSYWFAYDYSYGCPATSNECGGNLWGGSGTTLNTPGTALQLAERWLLDSTPTSTLARIAGSNGVRNTTATGAVNGSPGTMPTDWSLYNPDSSDGVSTTITAGTGYIDFRIHGTPTMGAVGASDIFFEGATQIACSGLGQQWWETINESLTAGSTANVTVALGIVENNSGGSYLTSDSSFGFTPTSLVYTSQPTTGFYTTTNASCAYAQPYLNFSYTVGEAFDITLRIAEPLLDDGTQWTGTFTRVDGSSAILAWDSGQGSVLSVSGSYKQYQDVFGAMHPVPANDNVPLTNSPIWIMTNPKTLVAF